MENPLICIVSNSSICEIRAWPKPGNIHRTKNFPGTTYQNFLTAVYAFKNDWIDLHGLLLDDIRKKRKPRSDRFTDFLFSSVNHMMSVQEGGNVLLGHLMLLTPLFISTFTANERNFTSKKEFWEFNDSIFTNSTPENTITLYKAIRRAQPGGMGSREKYDLFNEKAFDEILRDNMNLKKIFELSSRYDSISHELASNFEFIRLDVLPKFNSLIGEYGPEINIILKDLTQVVIECDLIEVNPDFNELVVRLFLYVLSIRPDSLIIRKSGIESANNISLEAEKLYNGYYTGERDNWHEKLAEFDKRLQKFQGKLNPGTTADLLAAAIYVKLAYDLLDL